MLELTGVSLSLDVDFDRSDGLAKHIAHLLKVDYRSISNVRLIKRSIDARKKTNVHFIATFQFELPKAQEDALLNRAQNYNFPKGVTLKQGKPYLPLQIPACKSAVPPVVVGAGPAGLFVALYLARAGMCPLLIEQGSPVEERVKDVKELIEKGTLNPYSNIQFGEGGAGTFSDGKLTTNTKNPLTAHVLHWFVQAGAPADILWQAHPHLGSDKLPHIVRSMREEIKQLGGTVRFYTRLVGVNFDQGALQSIDVVCTQTSVQESTAASHKTAPQAGKYETIRANQVILACGHSARDVFALCKSYGLAMEQKPFSIGVRIEHPQALINQAQWGPFAHHPTLGAAEYKLAVHLPNGRSVYTFCMCPGGEVVVAASEEGGVVTNGMSAYARAGANANSALLVNVDPKDFGSDDVLQGVYLQRDIEQAAFEAVCKAGGKPYQAPYQQVGSFLSHTASRKTTKATRDNLFTNFQPSYARGVVPVSLDVIFPSFIVDALKQALPLMGRKLKGFDHPSALMIAPETRSSSPVRICRNKQFQAYWQGNISSQSGLYPCGEGPGFAGGIMSAAVDGLKVAQALVQNQLS